ncbi:MAG: carbohydrate ABC transporter permease [Alicyclobacillus sp.]|nr:carbohydrate ABC transporter permease [Alicyclobacillus sp.]
MKVTRWGFLFLLSIFMIVPFLWLVLASFKTSSALFSDPFGLPHHWVLSNYVDVFRSEPMLRYLFNSIFVSVVSTVLALIIAALASYVFLFQFRFKRSFFIFCVFGIFLPINAFMAPYYFIINWLGLYDTLWGLVLVYTGTSLPLCILIVKTYMDSLPWGVFEAAALDGCSFHGVFRRIALPLTVPGLVTASVFLMIISWNELLFANLLTQSDKARTLQVAIRFFLSGYNANYPEAFAGMIIAILPTTIAYLFLSKKIIAGISAGAIKQ